MAERFKLSVIVPTFDRPIPLARILDELSQQDTSEAVEIIVVDDGSPTSAASQVDALRGKIPFSVSCLRRRNAGVPAARNAGASEARGRLLLFVDDDMGLSPNFLRSHLEAQRDVGPAAISAVYQDDPVGLSRPVASWYLGRSQTWARDARASFREMRPGLFAVAGQLLSSTNLSVPAATFQAVGGFDLGYGAPSCEDMDLGVRLHRHGIPIFRITTTTPRHLETRTTFREICERQRVGARETVRLVTRFPDVFGQPPIARGCGPLRWGSEPVFVSTKKLGRSLLGKRLAAPAVFLLAKVFERRATPTLVRHRLYDAIVGAYIQRGWREGLKRLSARNP